MLTATQTHLLMQKLYFVILGVSTMKWIWMILLCISLLISAAESEVHTLEFLSIMFSKPGNQSQYQQVIMFDGISISHCETANSGEELRRTFEDNQPSFNLKLQESIQDCSNEVWDFRNSFMEISHLTNMGVDLIQRRSGCTYSSDQESNSTFDNWGVNGTDFLSFDSNSRTWKSESPLAVPIERKWNSGDIHKNKLVWFLKDDCPSLLVLILKRRQEMIATNTDINIFGKPFPQNDRVSLRCHVTSTDLSIQKVLLTRNGSVMDQVRTVGPLHLGKGSILIRVTMELLNDKYMKTWSYRCEVHTIKNIISVLWDGLTLDHGDISPPGNTFSEWKEFTLKLIVIICVVILALVYFVVKHVICKKQRIEPRVDFELHRLTADHISPELKSVLASMIYGSNIPEKYKDNEKLLKETIALEDKEKYDLEFYGKRRAE